MKHKRPDYESMSVEDLEELLRQDLDEAVTLPLDDILLICEILHVKRPLETDVQAAFQRFLKYYAPEYIKRRFIQKD